MRLDKILKSNKFLAILSDFGNGKSVILQEAMATLSILGKQVFYLHNPDGDYATDIEKINNLKGESIIIIDDYSFHSGIFNYI